MTKKYTQEELNFITNNYKTMSNDDIGAELGLTREAIRKKLKRMGLKKTPEEIKKNYQDNTHKCGFKGIFHPLYGTHRPDELKNKLSGLYKDKTFEERFGAKRAEELKEKMSLSHIGTIPWNKDLKGDEVKKHYENGQFPNTGKIFGPLSEEAKRKISVGNTGKKRTDEWKKNYSESLILSGSRALEKNSNWQDGKSFEPYPKEYNKKFKQLIKQREGLLCIKCGMKEEDSKIIFKRGLDTHHINYNKQLTVKENCCCLCKRCHIETNFNRPMWTKFFQSILTERYNYQYDTDGNIIYNIEITEETSKSDS
jgi:hypothetical protein